MTPPSPYTCPEVSQLQVFDHIVPSTWNALPATLKTILKVAPVTGPSLLPSSNLMEVTKPSSDLPEHTLTHSATELLMQGQGLYVTVLSPAQSDALHTAGSQ